MDKPIDFRPYQVRAALDDRLSQTRRVLRPQPFPVGGPFYRPHPVADPRQWHSVSKHGIIVNIQTVPYAIGDRLYVREAWRCEGRYDGFAPRDIPSSAPIYYAADPDPRDSEPGCAGRFRQGIHMPRWASRLTLTVTDVRVQRLQDISEDDAAAEGAPAIWAEGAPDELEDFRSHIWGFHNIWSDIHGPDAWAANPWVCALTFTVRKGNIDA